MILYSSSTLHQVLPVTREHRISSFFWMESMVRGMEPRRHLDDNAWAYFSGGAADEITLRANRSAWDALPLWPRVLRPLAGGHTRVQLLGRTLAHPILLAPIAFQRLAHPDGELAMAYAAAAQGAGVVLSTQASVSLEAIADAVRPDPGSGPLWFQLYLQPDRGFTQALVQRRSRRLRSPGADGGRAIERRARPRTARGLSAAARRGSGQPDGTAGARHPPTAARPERAVRCPAAPRPHLGRHCLAAVHHPPARAAQGGTAPRRCAPGGGSGCGGPDRFQPRRAHARHGPATASALPRVVQAAGGAMPVLVDGGIRRGTDILKAMALGASAVLVGRPAVWGLAHAGAAGVAHVLRLLRDELAIAMALTGCATLAEASPALLDADAIADSRG